ncbi:hypothetical protein QBC38DRAFT_55515 [Podospora fimiseda]|uniref:DRBM domain-containing protein n=1 Tax=Podospora fimiseda TaxID=252190 RepID=A0AAN7BV69_9PEZI|nr:hypothetical protein QBC38DRAFT_55515 [Podospora fimiseda]
MAKTASSSQPTRPNWQELLLNACRDCRYPAPQYSIVSDRRGGRTAWSSSVEILGQIYHARYWYDGKNLNNAKEDAAEVALGWIRGTTSPNSVTRSPRNNRRW